MAGKKTVGKKTASGKSQAKKTGDKKTVKPKPKAKPIGSSLSQKSKGVAKKAATSKKKEKVEVSKPRSATVKKVRKPLFSKVEAVKKKASKKALSSKSSVKTLNDKKQIKQIAKPSTPAPSTSKKKDTAPLPKTSKGGQAGIAPMKQKKRILEDKENKVSPPKSKPKSKAALSAAPDAQPAKTAKKGGAGGAKAAQGSEVHSSNGITRLKQDPVLMETVQTLAGDPAVAKFDTPPEDQVAPPPHVEPEYEYLGELPQYYGTRKLYLIARDPRYMYAYWDFTPDQIYEGQNAAHDNKVFLQVYRQSGDRIQQVQIFPGSREWFLDVNQPGQEFYSEIGYYDHGGNFVALSRSGVTKCPPEDLSPNTHARFVTIPFHFTFKQLLDLVKDRMKPGEELADALCRLQEEGFEFPFDTPSDKRLVDGKFMKVLANEITRRINMGSYEITEILRRRFHEALSSGQWASSPMGASWSGAPGKPDDFFLHANAEVIIYGGTEPDAKLRINGESITLDREGNFRFHFRFPDGVFHVPIEAESASRRHRKGIMLSFARLSTYENGATSSTPAAHLGTPEFGKKA